MKTLKITDKVHEQLKYIQMALNINHKEKLNTLSDTIDWLIKEGYFNNDKIK